MHVSKPVSAFSTTTLCELDIPVSWNNKPSAATYAQQLHHQQLLRAIAALANSNGGTIHLIATEEADQQMKDKWAKGLEELMDNKFVPSLPPSSFSFGKGKVYLS